MPAHPGVDPLLAGGDPISRVVLAAALFPVGHGLPALLLHLGAGEGANGQHVGGHQAALADAQVAAAEVEEALRQVAVAEVLEELVALLDREQLLEGLGVDLRERPLDVARKVPWSRVTSRCQISGGDRRAPPMAATTSLNSRWSAGLIAARSSRV